MDPSQAPLSSATPSVSPGQVILPSQVWMNLTGAQQHHLLKTIVLVCQEIISTSAHVQNGEVPHE